MFVRVSPIVCSMLLFTYLTFWFLPFRELPAAQNNERSPRAFVMRVPDYEMEVESDDDGSHDRYLLAGRRFTCDELYVRCIIISLAYPQNSYIV